MVISLFFTNFTCYSLFRCAKIQVFYDITKYLRLFLQK
nr:MAG TPA: hypothetical protein [Caudoviricetes sp.]